LYRKRAKLSQTFFGTIRAKELKMEVSVAKEHSFDISAKVDMQEMKNSIDQASREVENRFDFKSDKAKEIELHEKEKSITILAVSDNKADAIIDILKSKIIKRELSPKSVEETKREAASGGNTKVTFRIKDVIDTESAKKITAEIKNSKIKVQSSIQGEEIRVKGKSLDDLQAVIALVKGLDLEIPLKFENFR